MTADDRLAEIRHRHLHDVDLGRWDEDEVGMLAALDAVLALRDPAPLVSETDTVPNAWDEGYSLALADVRAAITDALGGGA